MIKMRPHTRESQRKKGMQRKYTREVLEGKSETAVHRGIRCLRELCRTIVLQHHGSRASRLPC